MIIDSHSHYLPEEIGKNASFYPPIWMNAEALLKSMEEAGVTKSVLIYPTTDAAAKIGDEEKHARLYNEGISKLIRRYPAKLIGLGILPVLDKDKMVYESKRMYQELGLRGISLACSFNGIYLDDERFFSVYEEAQKNKMPIFVHSQTQNPLGFERVKDPLLTPVIEYIFDMTMCFGKLMVSGVFNRFPELKFVFSHFAGALPFIKDRFDNVYTMLRLYNVVKDLKELPSEFLKKIYVDTSGISSESILNLGIDMFLEDNILWGSDYPANKDINNSIKSIKDLKINQNQKNKILTDNSKALFNLTLE